jgi:hypothetical protein
VQATPAYTPHMKGRQLPDGVRPAIEAALPLIEVDPDEVAAWWAEEGDNFRVLIAAPIGLLSYLHAEIPGHFDEYATTLTAITPWSEIRPLVETMTRTNTGTGEYVHWLELELTGLLPKDRAKARPSDSDVALSEFAAECLRQVAAARR